MAGGIEEFGKESHQSLADDYGKRYQRRTYFRLYFHLNPNFSYATGPCSCSGVDLKIKRFQFIADPSPSNFILLEYEIFDNQALRVDQSFRPW